jgi:Fe-S-cluster-containing dehydrogenase component
MAQMAMVMNLDKCIGCHTCSVTCKQAWTNRSGVEYVWFNNVETRPGQGYPRTYQDQERWKGGWQLNKGRLSLRAGGRIKKLLSIFSNPLMPGIDDYYEPWTYDYETLTNAPAQQHTPVARPKSLISGKDMKVQWSANWDDDLGGSPQLTVDDPVLKKLGDQVKLEFEQTFMFYLPRICEHCLNPSCAASCPSGAIYKREEDGIVLVDQDKCRGWRMCVTGCPYKKIYFNHRTGKARSARSASRASRSASRPSAPRRASAGCATSAWCCTTPTGCSRPRRWRTSTSCTGRTAGCCSTRTTPRCSGPPSATASARLGAGCAAQPGVGAHRQVRGRPAAAPGVPHAADGLVHPAAEPRSSTGSPRPARRRGREEPVRRDRRDAHPDPVPRRAVHRRRSQAGP